eukprot:414110_1
MMLQPKKDSLPTVTIEHPQTGDSVTWRRTQPVKVWSQSVHKWCPGEIADITLDSDGYCLDVRYWAQPQAPKAKYLDALSDCLRPISSDFVCRSDWAKESKVEIFSNSQKQWFKATVVDDNVDKTVNWIKVQWRLDKGKSSPSSSIPNAPEVFSKEVARDSIWIRHRYPSMKHDAPPNVSSSKHTQNKAQLSNIQSIIESASNEHKEPPNDASVQSSSQSNKVSAFFSDLGLEEYSVVFTENGFETIKELQELTKDDLKELGVVKMAHRMKIQRGIITYLTTKSVQMFNDKDDGNKQAPYNKTQRVVQNLLIICIAIGEYLNIDNLYDVCRDVASYRDVLSKKYQYKIMSSICMKGNPGYTMTKQDVERFVTDECLPELLGVKKGGSVLNPKIEYDGLLVAFSGHGTLYSVVCSDSKMIELSVIREWFSKIRELRQIPQLFCIDACRVGVAKKVKEVKPPANNAHCLAARGDINGVEAPTATIMGQTEGLIVRGGKVSKYLCKQWDEEFNANMFNQKPIYKQFGVLYEAAFDQVMNDTKDETTPQRLIAAEYDRRIDKLVFMPKERDRGTMDGAQMDGTVPVTDDDLRNILVPQSDSKLDLLKHFFILFNAN